MIKTIKDLLKKNDNKSLEFVLPNGKEKYVLSAKNHLISLKRKLKNLQLNRNFFLDNNPYITPDDDSINYSILYHLCGVIKSSFPDDPFFNPYDKNDVVKLSKIFEERDFETDREIQVDKSSGSIVINGIILDLDYNDDFRGTYEEGIDWDTENFKGYIAYCNGEEYKSDNLDDDEDNYDYSYLEDEEIYDLVKETFVQANGVTERMVKGLYVIINNKAYYFSVEEYKELCDYVDSNGILGALNVTTSDGFTQLGTHFLSDSSYTNTLRLIAANVDLENRHFVDLTSEDSLGMDSDTFVANIFDEEGESLKLLEKKLKNGGFRL